MKLLILSLSLLLITGCTATSINNDQVYINYSCGPLSDGSNSCLDSDRIEGEYYTKCKSDDDCSEGKKCQEIHSVVGDVVEFSADVCR